MKKMNESRLLVTMVFGLMLGLLIIHPYNVMAAKPAGKDKKEVEANITHQGKKKEWNFPKILQNNLKEFSNDK